MSTQLATPFTSERKSSLPQSDAKIMFAVVLLCLAAALVAYSVIAAPDPSRFGGDLVMMVGP